MCVSKKKKHNFLGRVIISGNSIENNFEKKYTNRKTSMEIITMSLNTGKYDWKGKMAWGYIG